MRRSARTWNGTSARRSRRKAFIGVRHLLACLVMDSNPKGVKHFFKLRRRENIIFRNRKGSISMFDPKCSKTVFRDPKSVKHHFPTPKSVKLL